jgi:hypothetical protein
MTSPGTNGIALKRGLVGLLGPGKPRPDTSGIPLPELLGRALADASGEEYQPQAVLELQDLPGSENYRLLIQNSRIKQGVQVWANSSGEDRVAAAKSLATLISNEVGRSDLEQRVSWEIRRLG